MDMLKMFSTQLTGLLKRIQDKEEFALEDGARLLAQAIVGDGHIYIYAEHELGSVTLEATQSTEPLLKAVALSTIEEVDTLTDADRVLVFARTSTDASALTVAKRLHERHLPFVSVATTVEGEDSLAEYSHVHINLQLPKGLLPDEEGNRFGYPASIAALFVYYGLKFTIDEMLEEYE